MSFSRIALIGFGEVGQILAQDLACAGVRQISVWDILFKKGGSEVSRATDRFDIRRAGSAEGAVEDAELVISAVTAAQDFEAAKAAAPSLLPGTVFLDLNSASPAQKIATSQGVERVGARYVEAAVMSPFPTKRLATSMLLGGYHAEELLGDLHALGFTGAEFFSARVGQAAATKLCRSVMIKGIESLLTESLLAARNYGVEAQVLASLSDLLPIPDWNETARYMISRSLEHGVRRAEEMREAAQTVLEAGIDPLMSEAIADRQEWTAGYGDLLSAGGLEPMLDAINARIRKERR